jgi:ferredoxin--NADP+ reductase
MLPLTITGISEIAPDVYLISLPKSFDFKAGQVVGITTSQEIPPRLYSIASGEKDPELWILFNLKPEGRLTPDLSLKKNGEQIYISPPSGAFLYDGNPAWWLASGTGIAPFYSMFRSGHRKNIRLIHGGRNANSFYFSGEFISAFGNNYLRCCSGDALPGMYHGRLTQWLLEQEHLPLDIKYYLCGSAEMVIETRDILISKGIPFQSVVAEIYF